MKPRIKKLNDGRWACDGRGICGLGPTPLIAYLDWATMVRPARMLQWQSNKPDICMVCGEMGAHGGHSGLPCPRMHAYSGYGVSLQ